MTVSRGKQAKKDHGFRGACCFKLGALEKISHSAWKFESPQPWFTQSVEFQQERDFGILSLRIPILRSIIFYVGIAYQRTDSKKSTVAVFLFFQSQNTLLPVEKAKQNSGCAPIGPCDLSVMETLQTVVSLLEATKGLEFRIRFRQIIPSQYPFLFTVHSFKATAHTLYLPKTMSRTNHCSMFIERMNEKEVQPFKGY